MWWWANRQPRLLPARRRDASPWPGPLPGPTRHGPLAWQLAALNENRRPVRRNPGLGYARLAALPFSCHPGHREYGRSWSNAPAVAGVSGASPPRTTGTEQGLPFTTTTST